MHGKGKSCHRANYGIICIIFSCSLSFCPLQKERILPNKRYGSKIPCTATAKMRSVPPSSSSILRWAGQAKGSGKTSQRSSIPTSIRGSLRANKELRARAARNLHTVGFGKLHTLRTISRVLRSTIRKHDTSTDTGKDASVTCPVVIYRALQYRAPRQCMGEGPHPYMTEPNAAFHGFPFLSSPQLRSLHLS